MCLPPASPWARGIEIHGPSPSMYTQCENKTTVKTPMFVANTSSLSSPGKILFQNGYDKVAFLSLNGLHWVAVSSHPGGREVPGPDVVSRLAPTTELHLPECWNWPKSRHVTGRANLSLSTGFDVRMA